MMISVTFEIQTDDAAMLRALQESLAFNGYDSLLVEENGDVHIRDVRTAPPARPERDPDFLLVNGIDVYVESGSIDYYSDSCLVRVSLDRPWMEVHCPESGRPRADVLVYAIVPLMARFGYYGLHAGAVADGQTGYLFVGDSGGGKSTSTVLAVSAGWDFISDDFVYIGSSEGDRVAYGLRDIVCLREDAAVHFPDVIAQAPKREGEFKFRVSSREAFAGRVRSSCRPSVIVIPEVVDTDTTTIEPVTRAEVLAEAMRQSGPFLVDQRTVRAQTSMLRDLIEHCSCWRMRAGHDILDEPGRLTGLLSRLDSKR